MIMTQSEYDELMARQATFTPQGLKNDKLPSPTYQPEVKSCLRGDKCEIENTAQKKTVKIILPFRLPTWNMLLAANPWQRKKIRDWIHAAISTCEVSEKDSLTPMELVLKPRLMASCIAAYCQMITPRTSTKSGTAKSKRKKMKP